MASLGEELLISADSHVVEDPLEWGPGSLLTAGEWFGIVPPPTRH
jgi:hypothetical protein